jgi:predicted MFS family arabinose efflux permease
MLPFLGDAISYAVSVGSLFLIRTKFQQERVATRQNIWVDIREGLVWLWKQPLIRFMAILTGGYNLIFPGFTLITIVLAQRQHASSLTIGLIFAAGGIGAIVGAIFASFLQKRLSFAQAIIGATFLIVIATPLYAIAPNAVALGAVAAFNAAIGPLYNVVQFSYRLALIPDALQGRVNSVFRLIAFGGQPLGLALTGLLIQNVGVISTILLCTAGLGILAVATIANRHVRNAR